MKNINVLPTDKPSRLQLQMDGNFHIENGQSIALRNYLNIYITSDEEIKEGDWFFEPINNSILKLKDKPDKLIKSIFPTCKKIILTTDQDLIKDGVQAIDDEFLEWFVKNPSCEWIEVEKEKVFDGFLDPQHGSPKWRFNYKINLPKEEPKFENSIDNTMNIMSIANSMFGKKEEPKQDLEKEMFELEQELDIPSHLRWHNSKPKQETLEEAITLANKTLHDLNFDKHRTTTQIITEALLTFSSKWQQEQDKNKYSEEDLKQFAFECVGNFLSNRENELEIELVNVISDRNNKLFEKFKKK